MTSIKLGDKVRCKLTGFTGIAVVRSEFLNGCIQWTIMPRVDKTNKMPEDVCVDEQSLELVKVKKKKIKKTENGGAMRKGFSQRGF